MYHYTRNGSKEVDKSKVLRSTKVPKVKVTRKKMRKKSKLKQKL